MPARAGQLFGCKLNQSYEGAADDSGYFTLGIGVADHRIHAGDILNIANICRRGMQSWILPKHFGHMYEEQP